MKRNVPNSSLWDMPTQINGDVRAYLDNKKFCDWMRKTAEPGHNGNMWNANATKFEIRCLYVVHAIVIFIFHTKVSDFVVFMTFFCDWENFEF